MIVYAATTNKGKLKEFQLEAPAGVTIEPLPGLNDIAAPEETGATFEENAAIKANYYSRLAPAGALVFADDSGLEVDALGGAPGVHSARYSGEAATTASNNALLIECLHGVTERAGRFVCVIALSRDGALIQSFRGTIEGQILQEAHGTGGFGYDPLFYSPVLGCTLAEAGDDKKHQVSHRGKAMRELFDYLRRAAD